MNRFAALKVFTLGLWLLSVPAFATEWSQTFIAEGCGTSMSQARLRAKLAAESESSRLKARCESEQGKYTDRLQPGSCLDDVGNFHCLVRCYVVGRAECRAKADPMFSVISARAAWH